MGCTNKQPISLSVNRDGDACRYAYAGGIAGKTTGALSDSKNRGGVSAAAICKFVIIGGIVGSADGAVSNVVNAAAVSLPGNPGGTAGPLKEGYIGPRYAYVGGIAGQLMDGGSITGNGDTTNSGAVSIDLMEHNSGAQACAGGIVGQHLGKISATLNEGAVSVVAAPASGTANWKARCLGGIAGIVGDLDYDYSGASIAGSKNAAGLIHDRMASTRANAMPVYMGGIAGYVFEPNCTISDCTNSGEVNNDYYNNNIEYDGNASGKRANCAGGIVGALVSTGDPNVVSSCVNSGTMTVYRGMAGGVVGYASVAQIRDCTNTGDFPTANRNGRSGGIAAQAMNTQIEGCLNRATVTADGTGDATTVKLGGVVGDLFEGSSVRSCDHYGMLYSQTYGQAKFVGGGIAGTSVAGTTIDDCRFGGQFKGSSGDPVALMSDNVCGDKNFTGSGNTLWDGK